MTELSQNPSAEQRELTRVSLQGTRITKGAIGFLALVIAFSLAASSYALYDRFSVGTERATAQQVFNERIRQVAFEYCQEIEKLKKANRDKALESYRNLDATLELLTLKRTPAIVARAKNDRDTALRRFAAEPCPRPANLPSAPRQPIHPLPKG